MLSSLISVVFYRTVYIIFRLVNICVKKCKFVLAFLVNNQFKIKNFT